MGHLVGILGTIYMVIVCLKHFAFINLGMILMIVIWVPPEPC